MADERAVESGKAKSVKKADERLGELGTAEVRVEVIAALFDLSVRRIQQLTQEGILPTVGSSPGKTRYVLCDTVTRYVKHLSDKAYGKHNSDTESQLKQQKLEAEIKLKELQGDFRQLQNDIATGKYISVSDVEDDYRRFFITLKKFVLGLPSRVAGSVSGYLGDPSQVRALEAELTHDALALLFGFAVAGYSEDAEVKDDTVSKQKKKTAAKNKKV